MVQKNINASLEPRRHVNVWDVHGDEDDIRKWLLCIRGGDTLQVVPRAAFPAWVNFVYEVEMEITGELAPDKPCAGEDTSAQQARAHAYRQLDRTRREIRVLAIDSGSFDDPISCFLATLSLKNTRHARYEALSYCWGDMDNMQTIKLRTVAADVKQNSAEHSQVDELNFAVTSTLHDALIHLRPESGPPRLLWVDAVCVNQADLPERSHQVTLMPAIYSHAERVNIWLGTETASSEDSFRVIRSVAERYGTDYGCAIANHQHEDIVRLHDPMIFEGLLPFIDSWRRCNFAWFRRTWVLQEVANAKKAFVQCGRQTLPWPVILRVADCITKAKQQTSLFQISIMPTIFSRLFNFVDDGPLNVARSAGQEILDVVVAGHDLDASDPRDKIFDLLQFGAETSAMETLPSAIRPDYRKSTEEVFVDFTRWWIVTHKSLRILSAVHTTPDRGWQKMSPGPPLDLSTLGHPTWCFWHNGTASWAKATLALSSETSYRATGSSIPELHLLDVSPEDSGTLRLAGHRICSIAEIRPYPFFRVEGAPRPPSELQEVFVNIFDPIGSLRTWVWNRQEQQSFSRDDEKRDYLGHLKTHYRQVLECGGGFPCYSPSFFKTQGDVEDEKIGLCPHNAIVGDIVVVLYGGRVRYLLREKTAQKGEPNSKAYEFVGECFLHGYMEGQAIREYEMKRLEREIFNLR